jgi:hypothetical protein
MAYPQSGSYARKRQTDDQDPPFYFYGQLKVKGTSTGENDDAKCITATSPGADTTAFTFADCSPYDDESQIAQWFGIYSVGSNEEQYTAYYLGAQYSTTQSMQGKGYEITNTSPEVGQVLTVSIGQSGSKGSFYAPSYYTGARNAPAQIPPTSAPGGGSLDGSDGDGDGGDDDGDDNNGDDSNGGDGGSVNSSGQLH